MFISISISVQRDKIKTRYIALMQESRQDNILNLLMNKKEGGEGPPVNQNISSILQTIRIAGVKDSHFNKAKIQRLYRYPADYKEAMIHKKANKFSYHNKKLRNGEEVPICPCCQMVPATIDIHLGYDTHPSDPKEGEHVFLLQSGVSMYFTFAKMVIFYLLLRFLLVDLFTIIVSINGGYCATFAAANVNSPCTFTVSGYNLKSVSGQKYLNILDILNLILTIASIVFFNIYRKIFFKLQNWLDYSDISQEDYSVLIENIPIILEDNAYQKIESGQNIELQLKKAVQLRVRQWFQVLDFYANEDEIDNEIDKDFYRFIYSKYKDQVKKAEIVTGITLCYDLTQLQNVDRLRDEYINNYIKQVQQARKDGEARHSQQQNKPRSVDMINQQYLNICYKYAIDQSASFTLSHFTGKAFVSFQYQHYRDYFIKEAKYDDQFLRINKQNCRVRHSSKPSDIYWLNMKVNDSDRQKYIIYSYLVLSMTLVVTFGGLLGIQFWRLSVQAQNSGKSLTSTFGGSAFVAMMSLLTTLINYFLTTTTYILSDAEKHQTKNDRLRHLIYKTVISQGINTVFLYYILNLFQPTNPLSSLGLVIKVLYLVVISGFVNVIWYVFQPTQLIYDCLNRRNYGPDKFNNAFQYQLNKALQYPEFDFAAAYSFFIIYVYVVSFYSMLTPLAAPILIVVFILQYWIDKYNLFRRSSFPNDLGASLNRMIFKIFEASMFFAALGHFIWESDVHFGITTAYQVINIVNLSLAVIYVGITFFAPYRITRKIFLDETDFQHHQYKYFLEKNVFSKTFYHENPATACLKEAKIAELNETNLVYVPEAKEPELIKDKDFDKYLNLRNEDVLIDRYGKAEVQFYENIGNKKYDEITAELVRNSTLQGILGGQGNKDGNRQMDMRRNNMAQINPAFFGM